MLSQTIRHETMLRFVRRFFYKKLRMVETLSETINIHVQMDMDTHVSTNTKEIQGRQSFNGDVYIFRQLFDDVSKTFTYILGDTLSREAVVIDPVFEHVERDLKLVKNLNLKLKYVMNTHVHADHITGTGLMKETLGKGVKSIISSKSAAAADIKICEGNHVKFGKFHLDVLHTPGHTSGCITYVFHFGRMAFTGDCLLIGGCGRTDLQGGNSTTLYDSAHKKIFTLPEDYTVYPGHDYKGRISSTIREEKLFNPRLNLSIPDFIDSMKRLASKLGPPNLIDTALPANKMCGLYDLPPEFEKKLKAAKGKKK